MKKENVKGFKKEDVMGRKYEPIAPKSGFKRPLRKEDNSMFDYSKELDSDDPDYRKAEMPVCPPKYVALAALLGILTVFTAMIAAGIALTLLFGNSEVLLIPSVIIGIYCGKKLFNRIVNRYSKVETLLVPRDIDFRYESPYDIGSSKWLSTSLGATMLTNTLGDED